MRGELLLGGLGAVLMLWYGMSALNGLAYAFPFKPSLLQPARSRSAAMLLIWILLTTLGASIYLGGAPIAAYVPYALVLALPFWDISNASLFKKSLIILNASDETARPALRKAVEQFFGEIDDEGDVFRSGKTQKEAFRIDIYAERGMIVLSPLFVLAPQRMKTLETLLRDALKHVRPSGTNLGLFWIAVALPTVIAATFGAMGFMLLTRPESLSMRPTLGL